MREFSLSPKVRFNLNTDPRENQRFYFHPQRQRPGLSVCRLHQVVAAAVRRNDRQCAALDGRHAGKLSGRSTIQKSASSNPNGTKTAHGGLALLPSHQSGPETVRGDWCVYIQGDEVLHEATLPRCVRRWNGNWPIRRSQAAGGLHSFLRQLLDLCVLIRLVSAGSAGGAARPGYRLARGRPGFPHPGRPETSREEIRGPLLPLRPCPAPGHGSDQNSNCARLWHDDATVEKMCQRPDGFYEDDHKVKAFTGTHPAVMREIVAAANWTYTSRNPLIRFRRKYFWKDVAALVKGGTGVEIRRPSKLPAHQMSVGRPGPAVFARGPGNVGHASPGGTAEFTVSSSRGLLLFFGFGTTLQNLTE